jgi:ribosomal-protein-alanine N-acetyltransferase
MWRQVLISAARGKRTVLIAESEGDVIGFAVASIAGDEVEIESVAVAPAARRRGIGCRLCEELLDWARAQGAARVALEVRISNGVARALYGALGFQERGVRRRYYEAPREDAIVMVWKPNR